MIEKIDKIQALLNVSNVDADTETAIANMKILNLLVDLRAEAKQLTIPVVSKSVFVVCENDYYGRDLWLCCKNTAEEAKEVKGRYTTRNIYEHWIL